MLTVWHKRIEEARKRLGSLFLHENKIANGSRLNLKMANCRLVLSALTIMCIFMRLTVRSEEVSSSRNDSTLASNSCSNDTAGSNGCSNTTGAISLTTQNGPVSVSTTSNASSEGDNNIASVTPDLIENTTVELDTISTIQANTTASATESGNNMTTIAPNVTPIAHNTTAIPVTNATTEGNGTVVPNITTVETTTIAVEVTTIINTSTETEQQATPFPTTSFCPCDLTVNLCDNNCCCDSECSPEDRLVFTGCHHSQPYALDPRYCYQTQFLYHNNTELKMSWFRDGLFCILEDNLPLTVHYRNRNKVTSLKEFNTLHDSRRTFSWPVHSVKQPVYRPLMRYAAGGVIWSFKGGSLVPLGLPIKVANSICQSSKAIQFLQDYSSSCSHPAPSSFDCETNEDLNAAFYYQNISIIANPELTNQTEPNLLLEQCFNSSCISITSALCLPGLETLDDCKEFTDIQSPASISSEGTCQNVVQRVRYVVHHNGTKGLIKVYAYITLANISLSSGSPSHFTRQFSVEFRWANGQKIFKRSGRPGYLVGKPVIAGRKIAHISKEENGIDKVGIELSDNPIHWLNIPAVKKDGTCDAISRNAITFGDDRRTMCLLPLKVSNVSSTSNCASLQKQILNLLAGGAIDNITEAKQFNKYVATFGDSRAEDVGDWVQVLLVNLPSVVTSSSKKNNDRLLGCKSITSSMHIDIVFAKVGALANPQAKILGVAFTFGKPHDLVFPCTDVQCPPVNDLAVEYFQLVSSISFVDVTRPAETYFSEPPVYEVKLAYDFFYPFFSGARIPKLNSLCFLVTIHCSLYRLLL